MLLIGMPETSLYSFGITCPAGQREWSTADTQASGEITCAVSV